MWAGGGVPDPLTRDLCASISFLYFQAFFCLQTQYYFILEEFNYPFPAHHILITCRRQRRFGQGLLSSFGKISRVMIINPIPHPVLAGRVWRLKTAEQRDWKEWGTSTHHTLGRGACHVCAVTSLPQSTGIHTNRFKRQDTLPPWPLWMTGGKGA